MVRQRRWWLATDEPCAKTDKQLRLTNLLQRLVMFAPQFFVISNSYKRAQVILCITDIHHQSINRSINPSINNHSITIKLFKGGISMSVQGPLKEARWRNKTNFCWPALKARYAGCRNAYGTFERCLSVGPSVCHTPIFCRSVSSNFSSPAGTQIPVFLNAKRYDNIQTGTP